MGKWRSNSRINESIGNSNWLAKGCQQAPITSAIGGDSGHHSNTTEVEPA